MEVQEGEKTNFDSRKQDTFVSDKAAFPVDREGKDTKGPNMETEGRVSPSQKNMSQTRNTEHQGKVREKMHINHSVIYKMGSILYLFRWR